MNREEKEKIIEGLSEKLSKNNACYVVHAGGLNVLQVNSLRRICFQSDVDYGVYKNTLIRKALERNGIKDEQLYEVLRGESSLIFSREVSNAPAKVVQAYRKKSDTDKPILKAALVDSEIYYGDEQLNILSKLKSKEELVGEIISLLHSPAKNVMSALLSKQSILLGLIKELEEKQNN